MNVENQQFFFYSPPKLQTLASQELALALCRHAAPHIEADPDDGLINFAYNLNFLSPQIEGISEALEKLINSRLHSPVAVSFGDWCSYHQKYFFYNAGHRYFHNHVLKWMEEFALKPDGEISYVQTAKNLLKSEKLTNLQKYKFACLYCLVDDIERLWPLVANHPKLADAGKLKKSPLIGYWTDVMKGKFQRLSIDNGDLMGNKWGKGILLKSRCEVLEYFWNFLSEDQKLAAAKVLLNEDRRCERNPLLFLDEPESSDHFHRLFLKLSDDRVRLLMDKFPVHTTFLNPFTKRISLNPDSKSDWMLATWNRLKDLISPAEFTDVVKEYVKQGFLPFMPDSFVDSELFPMWTSAPAQFKHEILNDMATLKNMFKALNPNAGGFGALGLIKFRECFFEMQFFIALLSEVKFEWRRTLWHDYWTYIIYHASLEGLQQIMKLCFANDAEIARFKERDMMDLTKIENFCKLWLVLGRCEVLVQYLEFCTSNKARVANVKRQLLQSKAIQSAIVENMGEWNMQQTIRFVEFVNGAFSNERDSNKILKSLTIAANKRANS